jgi:filamentous hemagglutinin family protein
MVIKFGNWCFKFNFLLSCLLTTNLPTVAQVTPDQTLRTQVINNGLNSFIIGGTTVGSSNLFHSFESFNIPNAGVAAFINEPNITNIFARVTGGTPSDIQGLIYAQGTANLFLMNPNGIIFGRNAQLNIGGSFVATTANAIQFPGSAEFSLTSTVTPENTLLSVNPTAFLFNQIANQGINSIENRGVLLVPNNKSLILLGGNIAPTPNSTGDILMDGGELITLGGRVEIGGLSAPGTVGINVNTSNLTLSFPDGIAKTNTSLINNSSVFVPGVGGGDIVVNANNFNLFNDSALFAGILNNQGSVETKVGDISINATGIVTLADDSTIGNSTLGIGDSGNVNIVARSLYLMNGSSIQASAQQGNSGTINIKVDDIVSLSGRGAALPDGSLSPNGILSAVRPRDSSLASLNSNFIVTPTSGKSGGINIQARNLSIADGSFISANNFLADDSGDIKIQADNSVILKDNAFISSLTFGRGNGGILSINTNYLELTNDSQISASTFASGNAGTINIMARDINIDKSFLSSGSSSFLPGIITDVGNTGNINIQTERVRLTNSGLITSISGEIQQSEKIDSGGNINITANDFIEIDTKGATDISTGISTRTFSSSRAGDISLNTKNLILRNGGSITAEAGNNLGGNAGDITINASDSVKLISSNEYFHNIIFTGVANFNANVGAVGNGGELRISTRSLQLTKGIISAATEGIGNSGNITIISSDEVLSNSGVISSVVGAGAVGNAGDIQIQTSKLALTNGSQIDASIRDGGQGKGGNIRIDAADYVLISGADADGFNSFLGANAESGSIGQPGEIIVNTGEFRVGNDGLVSAGTGNSNNGGNITINARVFEAFASGQVLSLTSSSGKAGNITINATDSITVSGVDADGVNSAISAGTLIDSTGDGGTISLSTTNFNLGNEAGVLTRSGGSGNAGDVKITARGDFNINKGFVSARTEQAGGGNIDITAKNINLRNNSDIRTDVASGNGRGGNISLTADIIIALEDSDILAFAPEGQGGEIRFNTRAVFSDALYNTRQVSPDRNSLNSLLNNSRSDINATGTISGNIIGVPDISSIQNGLTELQGNLIDTNALIANSCIARSPNQEGTFIITGTGGLPTRPGEVAASSYPTGDVQGVMNHSAASSWKKGDPIVEPQGVYRLANGNLVMSRECS